MTRLSQSINAFLEDIGEVMKGFYLGCIVIAGGAIGWATAPVRAMPTARAVAASPSNQQAVSPLRASIAIAVSARS